MKFVIYHSSNVTEPRQTSNEMLVSFSKIIKGGKLPIPHSRIKDILMVLVEAYK